MSEITMPMVDDNGRLVFPPIYQDATETFIHNFTQSYNQIIGDTGEQIKILITGANNENDILEDEKLILDPNYSHSLIKKIDNDSSYTPILYPNKNTYTYGNFTLYYLLKDDVNEEGTIIHNSDNEFTFGIKVDEEG